MVKNDSREALHSLIIDHKVDLDMNLLTVFAAKFGKIEIMRLLVEIDPTCVQGQSTGSANPPLLWAIINENFDIADFLLSKGATLQVNPVSEFYPLHEAVRKSNLSAVKYIINQRLSGGLNLPREEPPLNLAIKQRKWDIASYLLQVGADPMPEGADGDYPTLLLLNSLWDLSDARRGVFTQLLDKGAYPNFANTELWTRLALRGDPTLILLAMEKLNVGTKVENREKYLCQLILAIKSGDEQALRGLLADEYIPWAECLVFDSIPWPLSPLALACTDWHGMRIGCFDVLLEFLSNRLTPKDFEELLLSVCRRACEKQTLTACYHILDRYPLRQRFVELEEFKHLIRCFPPREGFVRLLHDHNFDCYIDNSQLKNSDHHIYEFGNARTVKIWFDILKRRGFLVQGNESSFFFKTDPSTWDFEIFKLLLDYFNIKLCPSEERHQEYLSYHLALGNIEIVRLFLDHGFDVNQSYPSHHGPGRSPMLVIACESPGYSGKPELVRLLLDRGASVDAIDEMGVTALYHATQDCTSEYYRPEEFGPEVIKELLDRGANPVFKWTGDIRYFDFEDPYFTPLEMAAADGEKQLTRMFLDAMTAQNLKFDDFPALIQNCPKDDTRRLLTKYYWRNIHGN